MKKLLISSAVALSMFSLISCAHSKCEKCPKSDGKSACCQTHKKHCPLGF